MLKHDMRKQPATLRCDQDGCEWETEITMEEMGEWYQKECPSCNTGTPVSIEEISTAALVIGLGFIGLVAPKGSELGRLMVLNTAEMGFHKPQPEGEE